MKLDEQELEFVKRVMVKLASHKKKISENNNLEQKIGGLIDEIFGESDDIRLSIPEKSSKTNKKNKKRYILKFINIFIIPNFQIYLYIIFGKNIFITVIIRPLM